MNCESVLNRHAVKPRRVVPRRVVVVRRVERKARRRRRRRAERVERERKKLDEYDAPLVSFLCCYVFVFYVFFLECVFIALIKNILTKLTYLLT